MSVKTPEEIVVEKITQTNDDCLDSINIPKSEEYIRSKSFQYTHIRTSWPETEDIKGLVLFLHGYASHFNRPTHEHLAQQFNNNGYVYAGFDFVGHGYSSGERALLNSVDDLVNNTLLVIKALYSGKTNEEILDAKLNRVVPTTIPLYMIGHSMGGSIAMLVAQQLMNSGDINLKGIMLLCPPLHLSQPPAALRMLLDYAIVPLFGSSTVPQFMVSSMDPKETWASDQYFRYVKHDQYPANPKGLGWSNPMRFSTGSTLLHLADLATSTASQLRTPFLMLHDPLDKTVKISGAHELMEVSQTPSDKKKLVLIEEGKHDLLANKLGRATDEMISWIESIHNTR